MNTIRNAILVAACAFAGSAWAHGTPPPLNLRLASGYVPAAASSAATPATASSIGRSQANLQQPPGMPAASRPAAHHPAHDANGNPTSPPGVYYGDTSGRTYQQAEVRTPACDDSTYNQPQTHGSVSMGVMGGNHMSGNYQAGTINVTRNLGSCEHPTGSVGFSISVGQSRFGGRGW